MEWRWDFRNISTRYRISSAEVKVVWMIFWWKCDKFGDRWIRVRKSPKSPLEANSTLLRLFLSMPKSPLLIATSPCAQFDASSTGNQNVGRETGKCNGSAYEITYISAFIHDTNEIPRLYLCFRCQATRLESTRLIYTLSFVEMSEKSKMAACNRKCIWNNV